MAVDLHSGPQVLTVEQWRSDIDYLSREMPRRHKNLFHEMTKTGFDQVVKNLSDRVPRLSDLEIVAELQKIGAMVGDAHTGINPIRPELRLPALPLRLYGFSDGVFVQAAPKELAAIVGSRVTRIGSVAIDEVLRLGRGVTDHSNDSTVRMFVVYKIVRPELLRSLGIIDRTDEVAVTFDLAGVSRTLTLKPMPRDATGTPQMGGIGYAMGAAPGSGWSDARDRAVAPLPSYLRHPQDWYWLEYLPANNSLYVQCNVVGNKEGRETLQAFFERAFTAYEEHHAGRFILDLRLNGGGDNSILLPVIHGFIKRDAINTRGHLYVIIGRSTQSAAQNFVNLLERHTNAVFVGEPSGERPNHYGEPVAFELPNSKMHVNVSTVWWQDLPTSPRMARSAGARADGCGEFEFRRLWPRQSTRRQGSRGNRWVQQRQTPKLFRRHGREAARAAKPAESAAAAG